MSHTLGTRSMLDYLYFLLVLVVLLNIVFGIIIDTFSELRGDKNERVAKTVGFCFICGWEKLKFDQVTNIHNEAHVHYCAQAHTHTKPSCLNTQADSSGSSGFKLHIDNDHNMWNYLYFIIFIWQQDKDDDDGLELFVRTQIANDDISVPIHTTKTDDPPTLSFAF